MEKDPLAPTLLNPDIPKDLEAICLKAMEKEPHQRYSSAAKLACDLANFIANRPIMAKPATKWTYVKKWIGRNKGIAATSFSLFVVVILSLVLFFYSLKKQAEIEKKAKEKAQKVTKAALKAKEKQQKAAKEAKTQRDRAIKAEKKAKSSLYHLSLFLAKQQSAEVVLDSENNARSCDFSPDGKSLIFGGIGGTIILWDIAKQKKIATFSGHKENVNICRFSWRRTNKEK